MSKAYQKQRDDFEVRLRTDLMPSHRLDLDEFLDSFMEDVILDVADQFRGKTGDQTYEKVKVVIGLMIEAWQAGQQKLREEIQEL